MQRLKESTVSTRSNALYRYSHLIQIKLYFEPINIIEVIEVKYKEVLYISTNKLFIATQTAI